MDLKDSVELHIAKWDGVELIRQISNCLTEAGLPPSKLNSIRIETSIWASEVRAEKIEEVDRLEDEPFVCAAIAKLEQVKGDRLAKLCIEWPRGGPRMGTLTYEAGKDGSPNDTLVISTGTDQIKPTSERVVMAVSNAFEQVSLREGVARLLPEGYREVAGALEQLYTDREAAINKTLAEVHRIQAGLAEQRAQLTKDAEEDLRKRSDELEEKHDRRMQLLQAHEDELTERERAFDDREHKHARRAQQKQVAEIASAAQDFKLSMRTEAWGWLVHVGCIAVLYAAGYLFWDAWEATRDAAADAFPYFRFATPTILFGSTLAFWLAFASKQLGARSRVELARLQRVMDNGRAIWLIELLQEWREAAPHDKFKAEPPQALVEALSRDLFVSDAGDLDMNQKHVIEQLIETLGTLAEKLPRQH